MAKTVKKQEIKMETNEYSFKNLMTILITIVVIFGIFYFITTLVVKPIKESYVPDMNDDEFEFKFDSITLNHLLDRKEKEYYVIATKSYQGSKADYKVIFNEYIDKYLDEDDAKPFYSVNLSDTFNSEYMSDSVNISNNLTKLKLNDNTLFKIKNGKIDKYYVGNKAILDALSSLIKTDK